MGLDRQEAGWGDLPGTMKRVLRVVDRHYFYGNINNDEVILCDFDNIARVFVTTGQKDVGTYILIKLTSEEMIEENKEHYRKNLRK